MKRYANKQGTSGVVAYEIGADFIRLKFRESEETYSYSYTSAGKANVEKMKKLAAAGQGLSTFVTRKVRDKFEK
jgi:DhnA family fructose-bisphosphate aldolase class Ia